MPNPEKAIQRIENLEAEVIKILEETGLVSEVKIGGDIASKKAPLHLEYKLKKIDNGNNPEAMIRVIRARIASRLTKNYPEISAVGKDYNGHSGLRRDYIKLSQNARVGDGLSLRYNILQSIKKEIKNYLMRR